MRTFSIVGGMQLAIAQIVVGGNMVALKGLSTTFPMFILYGLRYVVGMALIAFPLYYYHRGTSFKQLFRFNRRQLVILVTQGLCVGFIFNMFLVVGLKNTSAAHVGMIASLLPLIIAVLAAIFLSERLTLLKWAGLILVMFGFYLLNLKNQGGQGEALWWGDLFVFLAVIPEAAYTILAKYQSKEIAILPMLLAVNAVNALFFLPFALWQLPAVEQLHLDSTQWVLLLWYTGIGGICFLAFWYAGLQKVSASVAGLFTTVMPISTLILAAIFLHEALSFYDLMAMLTILVAIVVSCWPRDQPLSSL